MPPQEHRYSDEIIGIFLFSFVTLFPHKTPPNTAQAVDTMLRMERDGRQGNSGWARQEQHPLALGISQEATVVAEPQSSSQQQPAASVSFPCSTAQVCIKIALASSTTHTDMYKFVAVAICILSLCVISFAAVMHCRRRRRRRGALTEKSLLPSTQQPPRHSRQERRSERRARRQARKQAAREYMRAVFTHWAAVTRPEPQESASDSDSESQFSNTMEEEIASFRAAVDLVDSLVAVEEGRNRPPVPEYRGHTSYNGCFVIDDDEESLPPPYDSEDEMNRLMGCSGGRGGRPTDHEKSCHDD